MSAYPPEVQRRIDRYEAAFLAANGKRCKVRFREGRYWMTGAGRQQPEPWKAGQIERWATNLELRVQEKAR